MKKRKRRKLRVGVQEKSRTAVGAMNQDPKARHQAIVDKRMNQVLAAQAAAKALNASKYQSGNGWKTGGR